MKLYFLINGLFRSIEYKLENTENLEVTRFSLLGSKSKTILLSSISLEHGHSNTAITSWLVLLAGCSMTMVIYHISHLFLFLDNNIFTALSFLLTITAALSFLCKPVKVIKYRDIYSNNILLTVNKNSILRKVSNEFIEKLNDAIEKASYEESNKINLIKTAKNLYETHNKNVNDLFNLGLIDENLYNRICNSMTEKVFGKATEPTNTSNVIYLNK